MTVASEETPSEEAPWSAWIDWSVARFGASLRLACSLSVEDTLLVDALAESAARRGLARSHAPQVFVLDTGRLHEESYRVLASLRERYDLTFDVRAPATRSLEDLVRNRGPLSFYDSVEARRECCGIRKVEPLARALDGASAWMTGQRRAQAVTRTSLLPLERDDAHRGIAKVNPLALVTDEALWAEAERRSVVIHPLHRQGYPSIGCAPCTRAVAPGEDARAGRWWWEDPAHKECGLHVARSNPQTGGKPT
ncbi:MAG: phosphoadenylyl-sulfate reductase [Deltaproteobacteria bacterium]|nr:phosphoadenylyl-sulfate reductase [Deltaproteobacteria bacterium]